MINLASRAPVAVSYNSSGRYESFQNLDYPESLSSTANETTASASSGPSSYAPRDQWPFDFDNNAPDIREIVVISSDDEDYGEPPQSRDSYTVRKRKRPSNEEDVVSSSSSTSTSSNSLDVQRSVAKRKRLGLKPLDQHLFYVPPKKPITKPGEIKIRVIDDPHTSGEIDETDGHYIVKENQLFAGGRYKVERLLGQGTFGRVVKARDLRTNKFYAVKIIKSVAKYREASKIELRVLKTLLNYDKDNMYSCVRLREAFDWKNHICLATELLDISIFDFMKTNDFIGFPISHVQQIAYQLFMSVSFLHDLDLIHTDLKPENIMLKDQSHREIPYKASRRYSSKAPSHRKILTDTTVNLVDFGSAVFSDEYHSTVVSTRHYRAPEIILGIGWSFPCDIWSIGCILVELWTGDALFQTHDNSEHLALIEKIFSRPIDRMLLLRALQSPTGAQLIDRAKMKIDFPVSKPGDKSNGASQNDSANYVNSVKPLSKIVSSVYGYSKAKSKAKFWDLFLDLLTKIFVCDPSKRITAKEALAHPWFKESYQDCASSI